VTVVDPNQSGFGVNVRSEVAPGPGSGSAAMAGCTLNSDGSSAVTVKVTVSNGSS
jgi:hypothetical protein